jgi:N-acetylmuramoyl-L-alanine amidase
MWSRPRRWIVGVTAVLFAASTVTSSVGAVSAHHPVTKPLLGVTIGIDPGHNGDNWRDPAFINRIVWNGRERETCDTTGTATDSGYTEALFNWSVAVFLRARLETLGAHVVMTRTSNHGVGPCVTTRALIIDRAHAAVAIDIHADGGPPKGRGFAVLVPVRDSVNRHVVGSSLRFGLFVRSAFKNVAKMPFSTYDGVRAIAPRPDLAGLNLTTVPKVLIECANMRNATDAKLLVSKAFQRRAALALSVAILLFLKAEHRIKS